MANYSLQDVATALGADIAGNSAFMFEKATEPALATEHDLAIAMDPKYSADIATGSAKAAVLWEGADWQSFGLEAAIFVARPRVAMAHLTSKLDTGLDRLKGIHETAIIDPSAQIGPGSAIGPFVVIGADVVIGGNAKIDAHCSIGSGTEIGDDVVLHAGSRIAAGTKIGNRFIAQVGALIGGDGFSFVTPEASAAENTRKTLGDTGDSVAQSWMRIHSLGGVSIGDDVEVGAGSTIDQGTLRATQIGDGTKIDSQVMIGHNVIIGRDCLLCGLVGVAGSTTIGNNVVLAGQVGVGDNLKVGDGVIAGAGSKILSNVPAGRAVMGFPAIKMENNIESYKATRRLPRLFREVEKLQKIVSKITQND